MTDHLTHAILCCFTAGLWLPCWLLVCCCGSDDNDNRDYDCEEGYGEQREDSCQHEQLYASAPTRHSGSHGEGQCELAVQSSATVRVCESMHDGSTYKGDKVNGQRHGFGSYCFPSHDPRLTYEGGWQDNHEQGVGMLHYRDGSHYDGHWAHGRREGHGTFTDACGQVTHGVWVSDKLHGRAKCVLVNGCEANGDFVCDKKEGVWLLVSPPHSGSKTVQTLWQSNRFVRFTDDSITLPCSEISTLLDATIAWANHLQRIHSYIPFPSPHM